MPLAPSNGVVLSSALIPNRSRPLTYVSSHSDLESRSSLYDPRNSDDNDPSVESSKNSARFASNGINSSSGMSSAIIRA